MGNSKIDMNILAKRVELLEMRVKELTSVEPEALNERLSKIEERYFSNKEMLTTTEVAEYLGVSQSQIYKLTMKWRFLTTSHRAKPSISTRRSF